MEVCAREGVSMGVFIPEEDNSSSNHVVIDPNFVKKQNEEVASSSYVPSGDDVFLVASFCMVLVELSASLFTLSVIRFKLQHNVVKAVTLAYYSLYSILTLILIADSLVALKRYSAERKNDEITDKQFAIKNFKEVTTVVSCVMWIGLSIASIAMELDYGSVPLQMFSLFFSIMAPALGAISAGVRAYEVVFSSREERKKLAELANAECANKGSEEETSDASKQKSGEYNAKTKTGSAMWVRSALFLVIALFEFAHCMCHFYEAYLLVGETNNLFRITDHVFLCVQATLAFTFLLLSIAEKVLDSDKEKSAEVSSVDCSSSSVAVNDNNDVIITIDDDDTESQQSLPAVSAAMSGCSVVCSGAMVDYCQAAV